MRIPNENQFSDVLGTKELLKVIYDNIPPQEDDLLPQKFRRTEVGIDLTDDYEYSTEMEAESSGLTENEGKGKQQTSKEG